MPTLTLASTILAFCSSVPIGWLFEAPDPNRRRLLKRMGLTRGETQGTSLALFYRCFALSLIAFVIVFQVIEILQNSSLDLHSLFSGVGKMAYIAFFLIVHLMKLHSTSLVWGVASEAMEYEDVARKRSKLTEVQSNFIGHFQVSQRQLAFSRVGHRAQSRRLMPPHQLRPDASRPRTTHHRVSSIAL